MRAKFLHLISVNKDSLKEILEIHFNFEVKDTFKNFIKIKFLQIITN